MRYSEE